MFMSIMNLNITETKCYYIKLCLLWFYISIFVDQYLIIWLALCMMFRIKENPLKKQQLFPLYLHVYVNLLTQEKGNIVLEVSSPSCWHTILASLLSQLVSQTVPHRPPTQISTRPSVALFPMVSRIRTWLFSHSVSIAYVWLSYLLHILDHTEAI